MINNVSDRLKQSQMLEPLAEDIIVHLVPEGGT